MFNDIGKKIKTLAKVICWIGIALSVIYGIAIEGIVGYQTKSVGAAILLFILIVGLGVLFSWLGSFLLYGFGELVDNSKKTVVLQNKILEAQNSLFKNNKPVQKESKKWRCEKCGSEVNEEYAACPFCEYVEKKQRLKEENQNDIYKF